MNVSKSSPARKYMPTPCIMMNICSREPPLSAKIADRVILQKIRQAIGLDMVQICISAAAPIGRSTLDFFVSLNLPMVEVFGMSETSGEWLDQMVESNKIFIIICRKTIIVSFHILHIYRDKSNVID